MRGVEWDGGPRGTCSVRMCHQTEPNPHTALQAGEGKRRPPCCGNSLCFTSENPRQLPLSPQPFTMSSSDPGGLSSGNLGCSQVTGPHRAVTSLAPELQTLSGRVGLWSLCVSLSHEPLWQDWACLCQHFPFSHCSRWGL